MNASDIVFVGFVVISLSAFAGVLGFASWQEARRTRRTTRN